MTLEEELEKLKSRVEELVGLLNIKDSALTERVEGCEEKLSQLDDENGDRKDDIEVLQNRSDKIPDSYERRLTELEDGLDDERMERENSIKSVWETLNEVPTDYRIITDQEIKMILDFLDDNVMGVFLLRKRLGLWPIDCERRIE